MKKLIAIYFLFFVLCTSIALAAGPGGPVGSIQKNAGNGVQTGTSPSTTNGIAAASWSSYYIIGDKHSMNEGLSPLFNGWGGQIGKTVGAAPIYNTVNNYSGFTCDVVSLQIATNLNPNTLQNAAYLWLPDPVDPTYGNGSYQGHLTDTNSCMLGGASWLTVSRRYKTYGPAFSTTGTWATNGDPVNNKWPSYLGITTSQNGATASTTITTHGGPIYLWYQMVPNNGGGFTWTLDSTTTGAVTTQGQNSFTFPNSGHSLYTSGIPTTLGAVRIPVSAGNHTVSIAVTSATSSSNTVTIEGVGSTPGVALHGSQPTLFLAGYAQPVTPPYPAGLTAFNSAAQTIATQLQSDGLASNFVDIQKYINTATDYQTNGTSLFPTGQGHIADAFQGVMQSNRNPAYIVSPLDFGAACNTMFFGNEYVNGVNYNVHFSSGSPTITVDHYTFDPNPATVNGGGDKGKRFCIFGTTSSPGDVGPCSYIASVAADGSSANLGINAAYSGAGLGEMGGYAANPADPSTAQDDSTMITNCMANSRLIGGKCSLPTHCMVHNMVTPPYSWLDGNNGGLNYGGNFTPATGPDLTNTILYSGITGYPSDNQLGIDFSNGQDAAFSNFTMVGIVFPFTPLGISGAAMGYTVANGLGPNDPIWTQNLSFFQNTVDIGSAFGWNQEVDFTGVAGGKTLTVSAITSNNFAANYGWGTSSDFLALGRTITGVGIPAGETITSVPPNGLTGTYGLSLNVSTTTASESMKSLAAGGGMRLHDFHSQHFIGGIGYNGDMSDSEINNSYCTGTFMKICWYLGPNTAGFGNGSNRWTSGRGEEMSYADIVCDHCAVWTGDREYQFNGGYNVINRQGEVHVKGGYMYAGGHCNSAPQDKTMIQLAGTNPVTTVEDVSMEPNDVGSGCGGSTGSLFSTATGATFNNANAITAVTGGTAIGLTKLLDTTNGNVLAYKQDLAGWPKIDNTQSTLSFTTSGNVGIGTSSATAGTALDMLSNTTTFNSSVGFPGGTTANRPTTGVAGMMRYNSSLPGFEGFYGGTWNSIGTGTITSITPGAGISSSLTSGGTTPITTTGTLYTDASYNVLQKGGLFLFPDTANPNTTVDIAPGYAVDDASQVIMKAGTSFSKILSTWTVGTGQGCLDAGSAQANKWYRMYEIERTDTGNVDYVCTLASGQPLLPTPYTAKRDIGVFETDGSSHILGFRYVKDTYFRTSGRALDISTTTLGTSSQVFTLADVPPGVSVTPIGTYSLSASTSAAVLFSSPAESDEAPSGVYPFGSEPGADAIYLTTSGVINGNLPTLVTNSTQQIRARSTVANTTLAVNIRGFVYNYAPQTFTLNFMNNTLPSAVTFTRASPATYYNSNGVLSTVTTNVPRFDYDPNSHIAKGLLLEKSIGNGITSDPGTGGWVTDAVGVNISHNTVSTVSPDGTNDASSWSDGVTNGIHRSYAGGGTTTGQPYTVSGYFKAGTATAIQIAQDSTHWANFDISNGLVSTTTGSGVTSLVQTINNGWYRLSISFPSSAGTITPNIALLNSTTGAGYQPSYTGTNQVAYLYGLQAEASPFATSFISSGTRAVDSALVSSPPLYSLGSGSFQVVAMIEGKTTANSVYTASFNDTTTLNNLSLFLSTSSQAQGGDVVAGSAASTGGSAGGPSINIAFNQAMVYLAGNNVVSFNGTNDGAGSFGAASLPSGINSLQLGDTTDLTHTLNGWIQSFNYQQ